jgi:hypothetical protein
MKLDTDYKAGIYGADISEEYVLTVLRLEYQSLWRKNSLILKYFSTQNHIKVHASRLV